jgi:hypothetical protein
VIPTMYVISKQKMKKKIRRIMDDTELGDETKRKIAMEKVCDLSSISASGICFFVLFELNYLGCNLAL